MFWMNIFYFFKTIWGAFIVLCVLAYFFATWHDRRNEAKRNRCETKVKTSVVGCEDKDEI